MNLRILQSEEYELLKQFPDQAMPNPQASIVVLAEDNRRHPIGRMFVIALPHMEGPWIHPAYRGGLLAHRMERKLTDELKNGGAKKVFAFAVDKQIENYLTRLGYKSEAYTVWSKEI